MKEKGGLGLPEIGKPILKVEFLFLSSRSSKCGIYRE